MAATEKCLAHDHDFDERFIFDEEGGYMPPESQMEATCVRCGITLRQSLEEMRRDCEQMISGKTN